ncbi:MAG: response regulator [Chloroflexi bacterium]|nr:response regulator [Chloroflexota bacterium]
MPTNTLRVLIADDAAEFRRSVRMMLADEKSFEIVGIAKDGVEAVEMAEYLKPDVAVMDINMPRKDGLTAIRDIGKVSPHTACMIMSSEGENVLLKKAMSLGVKEYLLKPFTPEEFVGAIKKIAVQVMENKKLNAAARAAEVDRDKFLIQLVHSFLKAKRTDDEALSAYTDYAMGAKVEAKILSQLAYIFLSRKDWKMLKVVCERMILSG